MFKEIEILVDHLALILLISCVLGEAYARESCVDQKNWGLKCIYGMYVGVGGRGREAYCW